MTETKKPPVVARGLIEGKTQKSTTKTSLERTTFADVAPRLAANGVHPIPVHPNQKRPYGEAWQDQRPAAADIQRHIEAGRGGFGVGILTGAGEHPVCAIDADITHLELARRFRKYLAKRLGIMAPQRVGKSPKFLFVVRAVEAGWPKRMSAAYGSNRVEFLGAGQQFVGYGIHPDTGRPYQWIDIWDGLEFLPAADLVVITLDDVNEIIAEFERLAEELGLGRTMPRPAEPSAAPTERPEQPLQAPVSPDTEIDVQRAVAYLTSEAEPAISGAGGNDTTYRVAARLRDFAISEHTAAGLMASIYNFRCVPRWGASELRHIVHNAFKYAKGVQGADSPEADFPPQPKVDGPARRGLLDALVTAGEIEARLRDAARQTWRIKDILRDDSQFVVQYGPPKSGKSFSALDVALSIASGCDWHGKRVSQAPVLYVAAEGGAGVLRRVKAWALARGIDLAAIPEFHLLPRPVVLDDPTQLHELLTAIRELESRIGRAFGLIVFDTLARCMRGDENSTRDMGDFVKGVDAVRAVSGASVWIVHHSGKIESMGARGNSSLLGALDLEIKVARKDGRTTLVCTAARDQAEFTPMTFELKWQPTGEVDEALESLGSLVPESVEFTGARCDLTAQQADALDVLERLVADSSGEVEIDAWRSACQNVISSGGREAQRKAFLRVKTQLVRAGCVRIARGRVSLPGRKPARPIRRASISVAWRINSAASPH